jgi:hypothetical protein
MLVVIALENIDAGQLPSELAISAPTMADVKIAYNGPKPADKPDRSDEPGHTLGLPNADMRCKPNRPTPRATTTLRAMTGHPLHTGGDLFPTNTIHPQRQRGPGRPGVAR